jgi:hypothetical protein
MDGAVIATGNVEITLAIESQAGGIHELRDEGFHRIVRRDLVERDGDFLPAVAAIRDIDISFHIHRWIGHGVKIIGNLHAEVKRERLASRARSLHAHDAACGAFRHARDQIILRGDQQARFGFAKTHVRPRVRTGNETRAVNCDVSAGNACTRLDAVNARYAVGFQICSRTICSTAKESLAGHSERSEESVFFLSAYEKCRFLASLGMTKLLPIEQSKKILR